MTQDITARRPGYYNILRPEILDAVPKEARRVLDLGCGSGALGRALVQRQECTVDGLDINAAAVKQAAESYDRVYQGNLDTFDLSRFLGPYDCIVFGDVLEHCVNPWTALKNYPLLLKDDGIIIASIPNVGHPAVIDELRRGLFRYCPAGILDITHLRFFTKISIGQMFAKAQLHVVYQRALPGPENPIQYLVGARKLQTKFTDFKTTIIIPVLDGLKYTCDALESIKAYTDCGHKVIIVDNGSSQEMRAWLHSRSDILYIRSDNNLGFPAAVNLGLECVDTPFFMVLNNDVVVTPGWLCEMLSTMIADDKIGIVGPMTNSISGPQRDPDAHYTANESLITFANSYPGRHKPRLLSFPRIVFFCALVRTELLGKVGFLDENYGMGNYEDDDYCFRSLAAGYKNVIDRNVFIHHYGSQTFRDKHIDYGGLVEKNRQYFFKKFNIKEKDVLPR